MKRWVYLAFNGTAYSNFSQWNQVLGLLRPRNVWFHCLQRTFKLANDNYTSLFDKYTFLFPFFFTIFFLNTILIYSHWLVEIIFCSPPFLHHSSPFPWHYHSPPLLQLRHWSPSSSANHNQETRRNVSMIRLKQVNKHSRR